MSTETPEVKAEDSPVKEEAKKYEGKFKHVRIAYDPNKTVAELLREMLKRTNTRVLDFFRLIDEDNSGIIAKKEWCKAFVEIGPDFPPAIVALTFDEFDPDKSGEIEFTELDKFLKRSAGNPPPMACTIIIHCR